MLRAVSIFPDASYPNRISNFNPIFSPNPKPKPKTSPKPKPKPKTVP